MGDDVVGNYVPLRRFVKEANTESVVVKTVVPESGRLLGLVPQHGWCGSTFLPDSLSAALCSR